MSSNLVLKKIVYTDLNGNFNVGTTGNTVNVPNLKLSESLDLSLDDVNTNLTLSTSNVHIIKLPVEAEWAVRVDGAGNDNPSAFTIDSSANTYLSGIYSTGPIILYNKDGSASDITIRVPTSSAGYAVKYNSNGVPQWAVSMDGSITEQAIAVTTDTHNNFYLGGIYNTTTGTVSIYNSNNILSDINLRASSGNYSGYAIKYNSDGFAQWAVSVDGTGNDGTVALATDTDNKLYMAGQQGTTSSTVYNSNNVSSGFAFRASSGFAAFATKHNENGIFEWGVSIDGVGTNEFGRAIAVDTSCNVYLGGYYTSTTVNLSIYNSNNILSPLTIPPATAFGGAFLVKYNPNGIAQWVARVDNFSVTQVAYSIATDTYGNVYFAGSYSNNSTIVYNASNIASPITLPTPMNGGIASFLVKYNPEGIAQWAATVDATATDTGYSVSTDIYNNVYLTGLYTGNLPIIYNSTGIPSPIQLRESASTTQPVAYDIKFNENGIAQWAVTVDGTGNDQGRGFFADADQNVFFGGYYTGTPSVYNPDNSLSPITIGAAVSVGGFIVKYRYNRYKLINNLTNSQLGTIKYIYNDTNVTMPLDIRDPTNTSTVNTIQIPSRYTEQLIWQNNSWTSLNSMIPVLKGGTGQSNLSPNRLLVGNGMEPVLTPNGLQWDNTNNRLGINLPINSNARETLEVNGSIVPSLCNVYDLGTSNLRWRDLYLSGNTIDLGGTLISAQNNAISIGGEYMTPGSMGMFRNKIINGDMRINQRGTSTNLASMTAVGTTFGYVADRWGVYRNGYATGAQIAQGTDLGDNDLPYVNAGIKTFARVGRISGNTATNAIQLSYGLESQDSYVFTGKEATLSFYYRTGANFSGTNLLFRIFSGTGTDEGFQRGVGITGPVNYINGILTPSSTFVHTSATIKFNTNISQVAVNIYYLPTGTADANDWFDITGVQLEKGAVATPFELRPSGIELALCQRYYQKSYPLSVIPGTAASYDGAILSAVSGTEGTYNVNLKVNMRATPTLSTFGPRTGAAGTAQRKQDTYSVALVTTQSASGASSFVSISETNIAFVHTNSPVSTMWFNAHYVANAEL